MRLNTNESPFAPPDAWREELLAALEEVSFNRYPDRPATELRQAVADAARGVARRGLLRQRVQRGPPVPPARLRRARPARPGVRAHLRAALAHLAHHRHGGGRGRARRRLPDRSPPRRGHAGRRSGPTSRSSARRTTRPGAPSRPRPSPPCCAAAPGLVIVDEAYGQFSPWSALELARPGAPRARGDPHVLQDLGHGRRAPRLPGGRPGRGRRRARRWCCRTTCRRRPSWPACSPCATCPRWSPGWPASPRSGAGWPPPCATCRWTAGPPTPTSSCSAPATGTPTRSGARSLAQSVLIRNCASWDGLRGCLRVTIGTAEENDRFLHALKESL